MADEQARVVAAAEALARAREEQTRARAAEERRKENLRAQMNASIRRSADVKIAASVNPELTALRQRCAAAQTSQTRALQILERELEAEQNRYQDALDFDAIKVVQLGELSDQIVGQEQKRANGDRLREALLDQATRARAERQTSAALERQHDRGMIDQAVAKARQEDVLKMSQKRRLEGEVREALDLLIQQQRTRCDAASQSEREAERVAQAAQTKAGDFARVLAAERKATEEARESILNRLASNLRMRDLAEEQLRRLHLALHHEEALAKQRWDQEEELRRREEQRRTQALACRDGLRQLEQKRLDAQQEEALWRQRLLEQMAERDRVEQFTAQRRANAIAAHRREVELLAAERRAALERDREAQADLLRRQEAEDMERARIVEDERAKLSAEHQRVVREMQDLIALGAVQSTRPLR